MMARIRIGSRSLLLPVQVTTTVATVVLRAVLLGTGT